MIKLIACIFVIALICWMLYGMRHEPRTNDDKKFNEDPDNFCPRQVNDSNIEKDIEKTLSDHDAMYLRDQLNEIHEEHQSNNITQY